MKSPVQIALVFSLTAAAGAAGAQSPNLAQEQAASVLIGYFERMAQPKPFVVRTGEDFAARQTYLQQQVLETASLWPLPDRVPLDVHESGALDHPWCTVRRVYYQLWPGVYTSGLLYMPKSMPEQPAPAILCPHGHWQYGNADPQEQTRALVLAHLGYVCFAPNQAHYEDLNLGVSNQTLMIWSNMRALDYLQTLAAVDPQRIGVAGISGGGLQAQMITALDSRIKAASIAGITCDYREILFPHALHCNCNHWPGIMKYTDWPEVSALGLPAPVQYLTMHDWTGHFISHNFPTVSNLYAANGVPDNAMAHFSDTGHVYDQAKRELVYWWMNKWLRNDPATEPDAEPATTTFDPAVLLGLQASVPENKGFGEISAFYRSQHLYERPQLPTVEDWLAYRDDMLNALPTLLGDSAELTPESHQTQLISTEDADGLIVQRINFPGEGNIIIPAVVLYPVNNIATQHVVVMCGPYGKEHLLAQMGPGSARAMANNGALVVLPDVRFTGDLSLTNITGYVLGENSLLSFMPYHIWATDPSAQEYMNIWNRNAVTWGRPLPAMAASDLRDALTGALAQYAIVPERVDLITQNSWPLAAAGLFAAVRDGRFTHVELDLMGGTFSGCLQPSVPFVLRYGDVTEWASLLADRNLRLRNSTVDTAWLQNVFTLLGNEEGLNFPPANVEDIEVDGICKTDWTTTDLTWRGADSGCFWWANAGLDGYFPGLPASLQGGWDGHPWEADAAANSLRLFVPEAANTYGQGVSNIGGTKADWAPANLVHFPFMVSFKVKPSEWVANLNIICNLLVDADGDGLGGTVQTFSTGGYDGIRCVSAGGETAGMAVVYNGMSGTYDVGEFAGESLLGVRFDCTQYGWRIAYDTGDTGTWEYPNNDCSYRPYYEAATYDPGVLVAFYARAWTGNVEPIGDVNIHLYDLTVMADPNDLPDCCGQSSDETPMPLGGVAYSVALLTVVAAAGVAAAGRACRSRCRKYSPEHRQ